ncbi:hypothetical protein [Pedobacter jamesrossensis]|uniref:Uncharacterized protein n=2 Tax=Pedobacter jamesrossensis TaxID=1908238 RepID=A0ABV8NJD7_9SPHI
MSIIINGGYIDLNAFKSIGELPETMYPTSDLFYIVYFKSKRSTKNIFWNKVLLDLTNSSVPESKVFSSIGGWVITFYDQSAQVECPTFHALATYSTCSTVQTSVYMDATESVRMEAIFRQLYSEALNKSFLYREMTMALLEEILLLLERKLYSVLN